MSDSPVAGHTRGAQRAVPPMTEQAWPAGQGVGVAPPLASQRRSWPPSIQQPVWATGRSLGPETQNADTQRAWRQHLVAAGLGVTEVIDRFYFKSIYFRIPSGILFEIATDGPGFATDEDPEHLGERLALPPFLEPRRQQIEQGLKPLN